MRKYLILSLIFVNLSVFANDSIQSNLDVNKRKLAKFVFISELGFGWNNTIIDDNASCEEKLYLTGSQRGIIWNMAFNYYFNDYCGLGINYSSYQGKDKSNLLDCQSNNISVNYEDLLTYFGPSFILRYHATERRSANADISVGYFKYKSTVIQKNKENRIIDHTIGIQFNAGMCYDINEIISLSIKAMGVFGFFEEVCIENTDEKYELDNIKYTGRVGLTIGVYFNLFD